MGVPTISFKVVTPIDKLKADLKEAERIAKSTGKEIEKAAKAGKDTTALNRQFAQQNAAARNLRRQFTLQQEMAKAAGGDSIWDAKEDLDAFDIRKQVGMRIRGFLKGSKVGDAALRGFQHLRTSGAFRMAARGGMIGAAVMSVGRGLHEIGSDDPTLLDIDNDIDTAKLLGDDTTALERRKKQLEITNSRLYRAPNAALGWVPLLGDGVRKVTEFASTAEQYVKGVDETSMTKLDLKEYLDKSRLSEDQRAVITERALETMGGNSRLSRQWRNLKAWGRKNNEAIGTERFFDFVFDDPAKSKELTDRVKKDVETSRALANEGWKMVSNNNIDDALALFKKSAEKIGAKTAVDPVQLWMNMESQRSQNIRYVQSCIKSPPSRVGS